MTSTEQRETKLEALNDAFRQAYCQCGTDPDITRAIDGLQRRVQEYVAAALAACARELRNSLEVIIAEWKVERDLKCVDCSRGLDLGRHGCHFEDYGEGESSAVGNCKAWPLSRRIKQLEAALAAGGK